MVSLDGTSKTLIRSLDVTTTKPTVNDAPATFLFMERKRKAYVAGPMRSKPNLNYPAFDSAQLVLEGLGWRVYNPAEMDRREDGIDWSKLGYTIEEQEEFAAQYSRRFAHRDLDIIINEMNRENGDTIVLLPGWEESIGANAEVAVGRWVGLRIITIEEAIKEGKLDYGKAGHIASN